MEAPQVTSMNRVILSEARAEGEGQSKDLRRVMRRRPVARTTEFQATFRFLSDLPNNFLAFLGPPVPITLNFLPVSR